MAQSGSGSLGATSTSDQRQMELLQLQKEYRHMEINRRAYAEESNSILRKQQGNIDKLRKDNEALKNEIAMIMRSSNKPVSQIQQEMVQSLTEQGDKYATSIEMERKNLALMEEQIGVMRYKILNQRRAMGGVNASKENHYMIEKQIRILENRLDKSLIKFNEAITHNKILRDQIDELRRERVVFENVYRKMERDLQERKKKMAEIIEVSNQAYEQRDTYQMEIAAIEQANRKEQEEFEEQMITLGKIMDSELQLPATANPLTATRSKSLTRLNSSTNVAKMGSLVSLVSSSSNLNGTQSGKDKDKDKDGKDATLKDGNKDGDNGFDDEINFKERAQNFEEAFNKIKASTGISDIDELVRTFIKNEEHNFSLFNYVTEQNNEIEKYQEQIQALKDEEQRFEKESGNDANQHKEVLRDLELKLQTSDSMAEKYDQRNQDLQRVIESLKRGMQSIFSKFDFESEDGAGLVEPTVTESNMVTYLGHIEKKANQLLQSYTALRQLLYAANPHHAGPGHAHGGGLAGEHDAGAEGFSTLVTVLGAGPKVPMGETNDRLRVNPPKAEEYDQADEVEYDEYGDRVDGGAGDEDSRPLTREELKTRTLSRLQRRMQGATSAAGLGASGTGEGPLGDSGGLMGSSGGNILVGGKKKVTMKK